MNNTQANLEANARKMISAKSTRELCEMFDATDERMKGDDFQAVATVRGLIMDELEARSPEAFAAWMEKFGPAAVAFAA
jgi:hypothetical protein